MCVCNSGESRVAKGFGVPYRSNSSDVNAFLGKKKKRLFLKANKRMMKTFWKN